MLRKAMPSTNEPYPVFERYTLADYAQALYRRRWIILLVTACAAGISGVASLCMSPRYEAVAVFYVPEDVAGPGNGNGMKPRLPSGAPEHAGAYVAMLKQTDARMHVLERFQGREQAFASAAVDVVVTNEGLVRIYVRDRDPKVTAQLANAYVDYFNDFHRNMILGDLEETLARITKQLDEVDQKIRDAVEARRHLEEEHNIAARETMREELERQRIRIQDELRQAQLDLAEIDYQLPSQGRRRAKRGLQERVIELKKKLRDVDERIRIVPGIIAALDRYDQTIKQQRAYRSTLEMTQNGLKADSVQLKRIGLVVDRARIPRRPVFPIFLLNVVVAAVFGLVVGVLYALLLDHLEVRKRIGVLRELDRQEWTKALIEAFPSPRD